MLPRPPKKLSLACLPTELRPLDRVSTALGGPRIWLKSDDQTGALLSGNKIRKLEYLMADAQSSGAGVVLTCGGLQSNHCRATAAVCARLGIACHLILRGPAGISEREKPYTLDELSLEALQGNLLLDILCGAKISVFSPKHYAAQLEAELDKQANLYSAAGIEPYIVPTGGSNGQGLWGYISAAVELYDDFKRVGIDPKWVLCATGSGGTQGGLTLGFHMLPSETQVVGVAVCDSAAYFADKIRDDVRCWQRLYRPADEVMAEKLPEKLPELLRINTVDDYIGPGYAQGYPELFECIRWVAALEGVVLDPVYTGKAFYGLIQEIKIGAMSECRDVVFVHTGGVFGLFPYHFELRS